MEISQDSVHKGDETVINIDLTKFPVNDVKYFMECYFYLEWLDLTYILPYKVLYISESLIAVKVGDNLLINDDQDNLLIQMFNAKELQIVDNILKYAPLTNNNNIGLYLNELMLSLLKDNSPKFYFQYIHYVNYKDSIKMFHCYNLNRGEYIPLQKIIY